MQKCTCFLKYKLKLYSAVINDQADMDSFCFYLSYMHEIRTLFHIYVYIY